MKDASGEDLVLKVVSVRPRVFLIENLFSIEKIDELLSVRDCADWQDSVQIIDGEVVINENRTSSSGWMDPEKCGDIVTHFDEKLLSIHGLDTYNEQLQLLEYTKGAHYYLHKDAFDASHISNYTNRFITFILYLNDVEKGGHFFQIAFQMFLPHIPHQKRVHCFSLRTFCKSLSSP